MNKVKLLAAAGTLLLLAACEAKIGKSDDSAANASAEARAEEGSVSIDVPGFAMKIDIPKGWSDNVIIDSDSQIMPPGAKMRGVSVKAGREGERDGVELRFTAPDAPAKVAEWYRDDAKLNELAIASVTERDGVYTVTGTQKDDGDPFTLQLSGAEEGGTAGVLTFTE